MLACLLLGPLAIVQALTGSSGAREEGAGGLFEEQAPLELQIRAPWRKMLRERNALPEHPVEVVYDSGNGSLVTLPATVRLRGISRLERCAYPPLTVRFDADRVEGTLFAGQTAVHATVPCQHNRKYEEHIVQEYLAYRIYETLAPAALRSRLVRLDFWNTVNRQSFGTVDAFLVEDFDLAAARLGKKRVEDRSVPRAALAADAATMHALFQFLIGHTDWSILSGPPGRECCHNAILLGPADGHTVTGLLPLPFDFDGSGLVYTGDTRPNPALGIRSVRQRLFRGFCAHNDALPEALRSVEAHRRDLQSLFEDPRTPHPAARARSWQFLESFFELLDDPGKIETQIYAHCRER